VRTSRTPGVSRLIATAFAATVLLAGCSFGGDGPGPDETQQATQTPDPTFDPSGGAEANKAYFDMTLRDLLADDDKASSHDFVDTLTDAGFDKSQMEVTFDRTTIDLEADYIIVSVKMPDGQCLIGQRSSKGYASMVAEPMSTGKCLIGKTQDIDW
jgi:hypothetical protein